jgi:hypothetical protein
MDGLHHASQDRMPQALKIVVGLFVFTGLAAVVDIVVTAVTTGEYSLEIGLLGFVAAWGLTKRRRQWLTAARVYVIVETAGVAIVLAASLLLPDGTTRIGLPGLPMKHVSNLAFDVIMTCYLALSLWKCQILWSRNVRDYFGESARSRAAEPSAFEG